MDKRGKYKAGALTPGAAAMLAHIPVPEDLDGPEADAIVQVRSTTPDYVCACIACM